MGGEDHGTLAEAVLPYNDVDDKLAQQPASLKQEDQCEDSCNKKGGEDHGALAKAEVPYDGDNLAHQQANLKQEDHCKDSCNNKGGEAFLARVLPQECTHRSDQHQEFAEDRDATSQWIDFDPKSWGGGGHDDQKYLGEDLQEEGQDNSADLMELKQPQASEAVAFFVWTADWDNCCDDEALASALPSDSLDWWGTADSVQRQETENGISASATALDDVGMDTKPPPKINGGAPFLENDSRCADYYNDPNCCLDQRNPKNHHAANNNNDNDGAFSDDRNHFSFLLDCENDAECARILQEEEWEQQQQRETEDAISAPTTGLDDVGMDTKPPPKVTNAAQFLENDSRCADYCNDPSCFLDQRNPRNHHAANNNDDGEEDDDYGAFPDDRNHFSFLLDCENDAECARILQEEEWEEIMIQERRSPPPRKQFHEELRMSFSPAGRAWRLVEQVVKLQDEFMGLPPLHSSPSSSSLPALPLLPATTATTTTMPLPAAGTSAGTVTTAVATALPPYGHGNLGSGAGDQPGGYEEVGFVCGIWAVAVDDMVPMAEQLIALQEQFLAKQKLARGGDTVPIPHQVDIGYHWTHEENMSRIQTDGLLSKAERDTRNIQSARYHGSAMGDGIYTASDPYTFCGYYGPTCILVARLKGTLTWPDSSGRAVGENRAAHTVVNGTVNVLKTSAQCIPLMCFNASLIQPEDPTWPGNLWVHDCHVKLQRILDATLNQPPPLPPQQQDNQWLHSDHANGNADVATVRLVDDGGSNSSSATNTNTRDLRQQTGDGAMMTTVAALTAIPKILSRSQASLHFAQTSTVARFKLFPSSSPPSPAVVPTSSTVFFSWPSPSATVPPLPPTSPPPRRNTTSTKRRTRVSQINRRKKSNATTTTAATTP
ncbi:hypothetical protein ACA910_010414 [Epithemia clementina (nom. ined.)]